MSAETTLAGWTEESLSNSDGVALIPDNGTASSSEAVVTLPTGKLQFQPGRSGRHSLRKRKLAVVDGIKKVLVVKVTDKNGSFPLNYNLFVMGIFMIAASNLFQNTLHFQA